MYALFHEFPVAMLCLAGVSWAMVLGLFVAVMFVEQPLASRLRVAAYIVVLVVVALVVVLGAAITRPDVFHW